MDALDAPPVTEKVTPKEVTKAEPKVEEVKE